MESLLHTAAAEGETDRVQLLLAAGADVDAADAACGTPLYTASKAGHSAVVQLLLEAGATVDAADHGHPTPMYTAAASGHLEVVQLLLAAGADVSAATNVMLRTPLHVAAAGGQTEVVQALLAAGADVNAADSDGLTPLHTAIDSGWHYVGRMVQLLLCKGANPQLRDHVGHTALVYAAARGHTDVVQLLLEVWGQPPVTADELEAAADAAALNQMWSTFALVAKELRQRYPSQLTEVIGEEWPASEGADVDEDLPLALAAMLDAWASDVSSLDKQRAALHTQEEAVAKQQQALQRLVVGVAGIARAAQQDNADQAHATSVGGKEGAAAAVFAD